MVTCHMYFELQSSELGPHVMTQIGLTAHRSRDDELQSSDEDHQILIILLPKTLED